MQILQSWKIYLDTCCLNRLFDPQIQERIRRETEAIEMIFSHIYAGGLHWVANRMLRLAKRYQSHLRVRVENPRMWLQIT